MKKVILVLLLLMVLTGCSIVRIDTDSIDNILSVILTKENKLFNQIGQGYKYYLPNGVTYIDSDELNDILYCNGNYYYLYIDAINYYYKNNIQYKEDSNLYYSKLISEKEGFNYLCYLEIKEEDNLYYVDLNDTILNASYILSTIKYNYDIVELMLKDDYFTNKTGKYDNYDTNDDSGNFILEKENIIEER